MGDGNGMFPWSQGPLAFFLIYTEASQESAKSSRGTRFFLFLTKQDGHCSFLLLQQEQWRAADRKGLGPPGSLSASAVVFGMVSPALPIRWGRQCVAVVKNVGLRADCQRSILGPAIHCTALGRLRNLPVSQFLFCGDFETWWAHREDRCEVLRMASGTWLFWLISSCFRDWEGGSYMKNLFGYKMSAIYWELAVCPLLWEGFFPSWLETAPGLSQGAWLVICYSLIVHFNIWLLYSELALAID